MKTARSPKITLRLLASICLLLACISPVLADETSDSLKALQTAMEQETKQKSQDNAVDSDARFGQMKSMVLVQLRSAISQGDAAQIAAILNQMATIFKTDAVLAAADKVKKSLDAERVAKEQALHEQVDTAISGAAKAIQGSKTAADLDESLDNLAHLQERLEVQNSGSTPLLMNKVRNTRQFVISWQDYIANRDEGNTQQALQNLQNIANSNITDLIPRSEVLARMDTLPKSNQKGPEQQDLPTQKVKEILDKTSSLDGIPATIAELTVLQGVSGVAISWLNPQIISIKDQLTSILQSYREYQTGLPSQLTFQSNPQANDGYIATLPLRVELLRLVIPQVLGVDENQKPIAGETIQKYLDRLMDSARQTADAKLISRIREVQDKLGGRQNYGNSPAFLQPLLAAQNQLEAGQFTPAVLSYEVTLKNGGDLVPAEAIGKHLEEIKKTHPEDYETGMHLFLNNQYPVSQNNSSPMRQPVVTVTIPGSPLGKPVSSPSATPTHTP